MRVRKQIDIVLYRNSLLYDISNVAFIVGDCNPDIDVKGRSSIMDICTDGNVDRVTRMMNMGINELINRVYCFTKDRVLENCTLNDLFIEPDKYELRMSVPEDFSKTTASVLTDYMHEFIVDFVIADWLSITKKDDMQIWKDKSDICIEKIRSVINDRVGAIKRKLSPF